MSRLSIVTKNESQKTVEELYKDVERRIQAAQPGLCPVDLMASFLHIAKSQSCGKCVSCRIGLVQLEELINAVLEGRATLDTIDLIEDTAHSIFNSADCAIGAEAARMVLKSVRGFRDDFEEHVKHERCIKSRSQPVPCVAECPAHVDVPGYISLVYEGRCADAVNLIRKDNPLPATCAFICEHPCEVRCRRTLVDDPINIRGLKRYAIENEGEIEAPARAASTGKKIAVIGGGPSGLSAAYYLSVMGHDVTIYEQRKQLGGMLRYGIPAYRLPREVLDHEIDGLLKSGFTYKTEVSIGKDISIEDLRSAHDALYIAIGAHTDKKIGIEGEDADGVISAVEMLRSIGDGDYPDFTGQDIVVVGGGNVAMDVARSSIRCGAASVKVAYRRRRIDMTALPEEVEGAVAEGCEILELNAPIRIEKDSENKVIGLIVQPQIVGAIANERPVPVNADCDEELLKCDKVLVAIGQGIDSRSFGDYGIPIKRGAIEALSSSDIKGQNGIFSGGDCVTGPATVIRAVSAGKVAAANIDNYLGYNHVIESGVELPTVRFDDHDPMGRVNMSERPADERKNDFCLMENCMSDQEAHQESSRCLHCDHFGYGVFKGGREIKW